MHDYELKQFPGSTNPSSSGAPQWTAGEPRLDRVEGQSEEHILYDEATTEPNTMASDVGVDAHQNSATGLKLFSILGSVTMAAFLMLLDGSIIGVVSSVTGQYLGPG